MMKLLALLQLWRQKIKRKDVANFQEQKISKYLFLVLFQCWIIEMVKHNWPVNLLIFTHQKGSVTLCSMYDFLSCLRCSTYDLIVTMHFSEKKILNIAFTYSSAIFSDLWQECLKQSSFWNMRCTHISLRTSSSSSS